MKSDSVLVTIAVVAVLASFAGLLMNYGNFSSFNNLFTGFVTNGTVNVTITDLTAINITSANGTDGSTSLNWGSGALLDAGSPAYLISNGSLINSDGWYLNNEGFIIENIGNTDVNLTVSSADSASDFIGAGALFQYNLTDEVNVSCASGIVSDGIYTDFSTSPTIVCENFTAGDNNDSLKMDILIMIPTSASGIKSTTVILGYQAAL